MGKNSPDVHHSPTPSLGRPVHNYASHDHHFKLKHFIRLRHTRESRSTEPKSVAPPEESADGHVFRYQRQTQSFGLGRGLVRNTLFEQKGLPSVDRGTCQKGTESKLGKISTYNLEGYGERHFRRNMRHSGEEGATLFFEERSQGPLVPPMSGHLISVR